MRLSICSCKRPKLRECRVGKVPRPLDGRERSLVKDKDLKMLPEDFGQMKKAGKANAVKARGGRQAAAVGEEDAAGSNWRVREAERRARILRGMGSGDWTRAQRCQWLQKPIPAMPVEQRERGKGDLEE